MPDLRATTRASRSKRSVLVAIGGLWILSAPAEGFLGRLVASAAAEVVPGPVIAFPGIEVGPASRGVSVRATNVPVENFCTYLQSVHGINAIARSGLDGLLSGDAEAVDLQTASDILLRRNGYDVRWIGEILLVLPGGQQKAVSPGSSEAQRNAPVYQEPGAVPPYFETALAYPSDPTIQAGAPIVTETVAAPPVENAPVAASEPEAGQNPSQIRGEVDPGQPVDVQEGIILSRPSDPEVVKRTMP